MRLIKARIKGYRSIIDSEYFDIESMKTILVGPNEAGKSAILQALQKLNPVDKNDKFDLLRDYPRSLYDKDIEKKGIDISKHSVVEGCFILTEDEKKEVDDEYKDLVCWYGRYLDNTDWCRIENIPTYDFDNIKDDVLRLLSHADDTYKAITSKASGKELTEVELAQLPTKLFEPIMKSLNEKLTAENSKKLIGWLETNIKYIDEENEKENQRYKKIISFSKNVINLSSIHEYCRSKLPTFLLFNNYHRIKPSIHLSKLAERTENNILDDKQYDYGNNCLLKFLGFTAKELSKQGDVSGFDISQANNADTMEQLKKQLDARDYRLNAATIRLTDSILEVWNPKNDAKDANKLRIKADGQYLKVVVEDELGVDVELDQRSEGFQWLVSFFVVFFSEIEEKHSNTILLLDEPGTSLHGLKQVEFQQTISKLSKENQTIFTTHSPFMVGANELDLVRVVEMADRRDGTKVHTTITAVDSGAMLPLQEALGYDLAQSLFFHKKNLVLEGLTDLWYLEAFNSLLKGTECESLDEKISLLPANSASKVVYYATILHAQNLNIATLFDSDLEGESAAKQDTLVYALGNKKILRTKDVYKGEVTNPEIEDLIRATILKISAEQLGWDACEIADKQKGRPVVDVIESVANGSFSKAQLAKSFIKWAGTHGFDDLDEIEKSHVKELIIKINKALKQ